MAISTEKRCTSINRDGTRCRWKSIFGKPLCKKHLLMMLESGLERLGAIQLSDGNVVQVGDVSVLMPGMYITIGNRPALIVSVLPRKT